MATTDTALTVTGWAIRQTDSGVRVLVMTSTAGGSTWEVLLPEASLRTTG
jgi:hypothetical protein